MTMSAIIAAPGDRLAAAAEQLASDPAHRVPVLVGHAFLERDDGVVRDVDVLRAHLGAALRDVAVPEPTLLASLVGAIQHVLRMHLEAGDAHEEARPVEAVGVVVRAHDVAHVLTEEALDAL